MIKLTKRTTGLKVTGLVFSSHVQMFNYLLKISTILDRNIRLSLVEFICLRALHQLVTGRLSAPNMFSPAKPVLSWDFVLWMSLFLCLNLNYLHCILMLHVNFITLMLGAILQLHYGLKICSFFESEGKLAVCN